MARKKFPVRHPPLPATRPHLPSTLPPPTPDPCPDLPTALGLTRLNGNLSWMVQHRAVRREKR
ncbi:MAG: hypothetical protein J6W95_06835 [Bacteroidales bacterium]|nr:hypothetical protein [Bacteroidales bacterium]